MARWRGNQLDFGPWLAQKRQEARITQRQLATRSGLSAGYLALLEKGTSEPPPLKTCKRLAVALGIDWNEAWQIAFATRLRTWLKRQGYLGVPEADLLDIAKRIESTRKHRSP
jgi:transcriptional regulator with XRE-family HTH domain